MSHSIGRKASGSSDGLVARLLGVAAVLLGLAAVVGALGYAVSVSRPGTR
jgi:hypothetical protein